MQLPRLNDIDFTQDKFPNIPISTIHQSLSDIVVVSDRTIRSVGTCFSIGGPSLFVTARHVIEEALTLCAENEGSHIAAIHTAPGFRDSRPEIFTNHAHVSQANIRDEHDIALIVAPWIHNGEYVNPTPLQLDCEIPGEGERVLALGFTRGTYTRDEDGDGGIQYILENTLHAADGHVRAAYSAGRDSVMAPFPGFETDIRIDAGMSGGPVISATTGSVCGVVCSSFDEGADATSHVSYISAAALTLNLNDPRDPSEATTFLELARNGEIRTFQDPRSIRSEPRGDGVRLWIWSRPPVIVSD